MINKFDSYFLMLDKIYFFIKGWAFIYNFSIILMICAYSISNEGQPFLIQIDNIYTENGFTDHKIVTEMLLVSMEPTLST